jgi:hypothetical protein
VAAAAERERTVGGHGCWCCESFACSKHRSIIRCAQVGEPTFLKKDLGPLLGRKNKSPN